MEKWKQMAELWQGAKLVDLSRIMENGMPIASDLSKYYHELWASYEYGDGCLCYQLIMNEHTGTHLDAPAHMLGKETGAQVFLHENPIRMYSFPCAVIPCLKDASGEITVEDIQAWESEYGALQCGEGVFFRTGWDEKWKAFDPEKTFLTDWPGLSSEAAAYLADKEIVAVGTDCLSIDVFGAPGCPAHKTLLKDNITVFENLIHLDQIPARCFIMSLPLPIWEGTGSPVRVVAIVD